MTKYPLDRYLVVVLGIQLLILNEYIFPAVLALGPEVRASGIDIITAAVLGYEAMVRIGKALNPSSHYQRGFHPTGTCGVFGSAVAAAKLLHLDE